jgi:hypothetical protein
VSAQKITASRRLLALYDETRRRDIKAREIAEREGISWSEATAKVMNMEEGK